MNDHRRFVDDAERRDAHQSNFRKFRRRFDRHRHLGEGRLAELVPTVLEVFAEDDVNDIGGRGRCPEPEVDRVLVSDRARPTQNAELGIELGLFGELDLRSLLGLASPEPDPVPVLVVASEDGVARRHAADVVAVGSRDAAMQLRELLAQVPAAAATSGAAARARLVLRQARRPGKEAASFC